MINWHNTNFFLNIILYLLSSVIVFLHPAIFKRVTDGGKDLQSNVIVSVSKLHQAILTALRLEKISKLLRIIKFFFYN